VQRPSLKPIVLLSRCRTQELNPVQGSSHKSWSQVLILQRPDWTSLSSTGLLRTCS